MRTLATAAMLLWALTGAARADTTLTTLATLDASKGWEAVGRLNLGDRGFCTAALIAPDLVLTAAHCLYDKETGARFPVEQMQFLADWRMGRAAAYRKVRRAVAPAGYSYDSPDKLTRIAHDVALIELEQPIRLPSIRPFEIGTETETGAAVGVVSYAKDRAEAPSLQQTCHVIGQRTGLFVLSCDIDFGSSGAPVFALQDGVAKIVSVISAKAESEGRPVGLGVDLAGQVAGLKARLDAIDRGTLLEASSDEAGGQAPAPKVIRLGGGGGAKFVRP